MNTDLCNAFVKICTEHYRKVCETGMLQENRSIFGTPPESIIICFGFSQKNDEWKPLSEKEAVFRYSSHGLQTAAPDTVPDNTANGMYYKEAYAELCCQENGVAFMMIQFGKRYARCYRYRIEQDAETIQLVDETLIWAS